MLPFSLDSSRGCTARSQGFRENAKVRKPLGHAWSFFSSWHFPGWPGHREIVVSRKVDIRLHGKENSKLPWRKAGQPSHLVDVLDPGWPGHREIVRDW